VVGEASIGLGAKTGKSPKYWVLGRTKVTVQTAEAL